jgi:hypothetical protein
MDWDGSQTQHAPRGGPTIDAIYSPTRIGEVYEILLEKFFIVDPIIDGALNIFEDVLGSLPM